MAVFIMSLDELIEIIDYSLKNGYTVNWDGDTSEDGFTFAEVLQLIREMFPR